LHSLQVEMATPPPFFNNLTDMKSTTITFTWRSTADLPTEGRCILLLDDRGHITVQRAWSGLLNWMEGNDHVVWVYASEIV